MVLVVKNLPANTGGIRDAGSIPVSGRSPAGGHGNLLQYSHSALPPSRVWEAPGWHTWPQDLDSVPGSAWALGSWMKPGLLQTPAKSRVSEALGTHP